MIQDRVIKCWRERNSSSERLHTVSDPCLTTTLSSARLWKFQRFTHIFHGPGPGCPVTATLAPVRGLADRSRTVTTSRTVPPVTTRWPTTPSTNIIKMHSGHLVINNYNLTPHARQIFKNDSNPHFSNHPFSINKCFNDLKLFYNG